jgi:RNase P subunit RPR2
VTTQASFDPRWAPLGIDGPQMPSAIVITCERCGRRHRLERRRTEPEAIRLVCHGCEMSLIAEFRP